MRITKLWFRLWFLSVALQHCTWYLKDAYGKKDEIHKAGALGSVEKISFEECCWAICSHAFRGYEDCPDEFDLKSSLQLGVSVCVTFILTSQVVNEYVYNFLLHCVPFLVRK